MTEAFKLKGLTVSCSQQVILNIQQLALDQGKIYAVVGPSGAGKSTLLRVLNLLQEPTTGKVEFFGQALIYGGRRRLDQQREMVMVFQKPAIFSGSVNYNVALGLTLRGTASQKAKAKVAEALQRVGLSGLGNRLASTLSGGEAQRVALARAMVIEPKVLLLDEPTSNLDPANVAIFEKLVKGINKEQGTTVILVTHNLHQARRVADEIIFLNHGQLVEKGTVEDMYNNPGVQTTRAFLAGELIY